MSPCHPITGATRLVGVLGWPVAHSLSPQMQNAAFAALGIDWAYVPFPVPPERLANAVRGLVALGFAGANATVPHKPALARLMDELTPVAATIGAVNTVIIRPDGSLLGDSTDGYGFLMDLRAHGVRVGEGESGRKGEWEKGRVGEGESGRKGEWEKGRVGEGEKGRQGDTHDGHVAISTPPPADTLTHPLPHSPTPHRVLVIGAGGAARGVVYALAEAGASVAVVNRTVAVAEALCRIVGEALPHADVSAHAFPGALPSLATDAELIVNTTSLGLHGDADALPWDAAIPFRPDQVVYDLIYHVRTPFLKLADAAGARAIDGLGMLVYQGARSAALWTGQDEHELAHWMAKELHTP